MQVQMKSWKLGGAMITLAVVLSIGTATFVNAQERKRDAAEIQAQIERLQAELQQVKAEGEKPVAKPKTDISQILPGKYLGMEGNDWIGIVIGEFKDGVFPITIYEDGLPEHGYNPKDDDKYVGTTTLSFNGDFTKAWLGITLTQKFDGQREEPVEQVLRTIKAPVETQVERNGVKITIPRNREWSAVSVTKEMPEQQPGRGDYYPIAGRYLGWEGDDRMGLIITAVADGQYDVVFYEDGLPGAGYNLRDDDRFEGTATLRGNKLEINITKKFDDNRPDRLERALQNMTATVNVDNGRVGITIPRNAEWDGVSLKKL